MNCHVPKCTRQATRRGLCLPCYQVARNLVIAKATTWEQLAADGKITPLKRDASAARKFFLTTPTTTPKA